DQLLIVLNNYEIDKLKQNQFEYEIIIDDVIEYYHTNVRLPDAVLPEIEKNMKNKYQIEGFEFGSMGGYYTFNEIVVELDSMRLLYPNLITSKQSIGTSVEGRDIWMVKISDNPDITENEPEVFFNSLIHAREPQSMASLMYFMYYLLENYGADPLVTYLLDNRELYFVPVINPDGYVYNQTIEPNGGGMWRKNCCDNDSNGVFTWDDGVDLNRNFGYMWGYDDIGSSPDPNTATYRGTAPFSEPESQVIRDFCVNHNFQLASNIHSAMQMVITPFSHDLSLPPDSILFFNLGKEMIKYSGYGLNHPAYIYAVNGDASDWMYADTTKNKTIAFTYEVGPDRDAWDETLFWPSQDKIFPTAHLDLYPQFIIALGQGVIEPDSTFNILQASLNSTALTAGIDTLFINADVFSPDSSALEMKAIVESFDLSYKEIINLNDMLPKSKLPGTYNFSGIWPIPANIEHHYFVNVIGTSLPTNIQLMKYAGRFTSIGPVDLENFTFSGDTIIDPGDNRKFQFTLYNASATATATNVTSQVVCLDTFATISTLATSEYGDITAGASATGNLKQYIRFSNYCIAAQQIPLALNIFSDDYQFWSDTFYVDINPSGLEKSDQVLPFAFALKQNYPNPFNPITNIEFSIPKTEYVTLKIYNILGQEVVALVSEKLKAGNYKYTWDA
ncbi:M14 family zinc carboxypeptidase, partial [Calditrichota bacterium]